MYTVGKDFLGTLVPSCFLGALFPVDLRAVCFTRVIYNIEITIFRKTKRKENFNKIYGLYVKKNNIEKKHIVF